ncbi:S1 RNA-binding domain-containing protein [Halarcobacter ebronensis]|uniref:DNA-binding protein n=1 Tax=Halarcobacter ebronensis TaxID=1462615 RepID=A0A4Q1AEE7_9BACT|nr:S1-like domain-containing RNA-binding protein [Halarcobacter ebronensis]QKF81242.1 putative RNA-binding protein (S1 domain) [Halarcobacter ebronensis]RXK01804.1 DNA-binding protein [Halarcobacter ebronensis]
MNKKIELGVINTLKVNRVSEPGLYLCSLDEQEVLLPNCYVKQEMKIDSTLEVFIYTDSEDRLVATTLTPYGKKDDFVCLEVVDSTKFGAFLDMGLTKDLLVPKNRQRSTFNVGSRKVIQIVEDEKTNRLIGTEKFVLEKFPANLENHSEVEILLYMKTPLGFKVIVNNAYEGLIYHNEIFEKINIGDRKKAYVKNLREDGKLDISLQKIGEEKKDDDANRILDILSKNGGEMTFTYKSTPEDIKKSFGLSRKAFKASLTKLIEENKIELLENSIKVK